MIIYDLLHIDGFSYGMSIDYYVINRRFALVLYLGHYRFRIGWQLL